VSRRSVEEWRREVYRSPRINDATRVYLLYLADHMRSDRKVSIPQASIEKALGKPKRRIDSRRAFAIRAGFLSRVSAGYRGSTAVYQGTFPAQERVTSLSTLSGPQSDTLSPHEWVSLGSTPLLGADLIARGTDRNVGSDEDPQGPLVRSDLLVCECHGLADCASLNRHDREQSA
jgi:hypothetical protein